MGTARMGIQPCGFVCAALCTEKYAVRVTRSLKETADWLEGMRNG
jgi:hypothetical protein